jgi:hypothetical protein
MPSATLRELQYDPVSNRLLAAVRGVWAPGSQSLANPDILSSSPQVEFVELIKRSNHAKKNTREIRWALLRRLGLMSSAGP